MTNRNNNPRDVHTPRSHHHDNPATAMPENPTLDNAEAFLRSPEGLRTVLVVLDRLGPGAWATLPVAIALMEHAQERFAPVAQSWRRPVEDATYAAFLAMRGRSARTANDPWAVVTRAVELSMQAEAYGERLLISPDKARRRQHRPSMSPVRAGNYEEFLYDVLSTEDVAVSGDHDIAGDSAGPVVTTSAAMLTIAGWREANALWACEYIASRTADMGSQESAIDVLRRDVARLRVGLDKPEWAHLLTLLIGTKPRPGNPGGIGVFARVLLGETLSELLGDSLLVAHAQRTLNRESGSPVADEQGDGRE